MDENSSGVEGGAPAAANGGAYAAEGGGAEIKSIGVTNSGNKGFVLVLESLVIVTSEEAEFVVVLLDVGIFPDIGFIFGIGDKSAGIKHPGTTPVVGVNQAHVAFFPPEVIGDGFCQNDGLHNSSASKGEGIVGSEGLVHDAIQIEIDGSHDDAMAPGVVGVG